VQSIEFRAPWSKGLRIATGFSIAILVVVFCAGLVSVQLQAPWFVSAALIATPILITAGALRFMVRGYVLTESGIVVRRLGWETLLPLAELKSIGGDAEAMRNSLRLFGNGGLFSFTGLFWNRRVGRYRALATDPDRAVVLRYPKRTIVITPHDPQHFIMRARTILKK
jgi:hypothetical protein